MVVVRWKGRQSACPAQTVFTVIGGAVCAPYVAAVENFTVVPTLTLPDVSIACAWVR